MTMTKSAFLPVFVAVGLPVAALAQIGLGDQVGKTDEEINAALAAAGASVLAIEREDNEVEVDYMLGDAAFSLEIDTGTGTVIELAALDDEDDAGDDADDDDDDDAEDEDDGDDDDDEEDDEDEEGDDD